MVAAVDTEITRLRNRVAELEGLLLDALTAAHHDPLTGLYNRAGLEAAYASVPNGYQLAILDLDRFKHINDTHGHAAGDAVLGIIAGQLTRNPIAARLGGDEFVVIGDTVGYTRAWRVPLPDRSAIAVTATVGVAEVVPGDLYETLRRADAAMYRAKRSLRGGLAVYDPAADARPREPRPRLRLRDAIPPVDECGSR